MQQLKIGIKQGSIFNDLFCFAISGFPNTTLQHAEGTPGDTCSRRQYQNNVMPKIQFIHQCNEARFAIQYYLQDHALAYELDDSCRITCYTLSTYLDIK